MTKPAPERHYESAQEEFQRRVRDRLLVSWRFEMTSEEIKKWVIQDGPTEEAYIRWETASWLKEIAYQLAVMNENRKKPLTVFTYSDNGDPR